jgi:chemotaxis response regulator CheB
MSILSGLDADGVAALRAIKAAGGITFAQKIETAKFPDMPWHAIKTGCIDFILSPAAIGRRLRKIKGPRA